MLMSVLIGALLIAATVSVHLAGTLAWATWTRSRSPHYKGRFGALRLLILTALILFLMHTIEVVIWAIAYLQLTSVQAVTTFEEAVYFSMVTFTTLGYGDIVLSGHMRLLSGIEALNGLLLFGWSTAMFFNVVQRVMGHPSE